MAHSEFDDIQLHEELRHLFELDTQKYLQLYVQTVNQLNAANWREDIQQLYRCVHTIKGGAVTVGFQSVLQVSTVLEDLLSDLRYLDVAPPLMDGELSKSLVEAGELLIGTVQKDSSQTGELGESDFAVRYIQNLRDRIQSQYLPEWNEMRQVQQEFADQGFDLVILDLEMAIEVLPATGTVPTEICEIAQQTIAQLQSIGTEINLATAWQDFLKTGLDLCDRPNCELWHAEWMPFLRKLKDSARQGGVLPIEESVTSSISNLAVENEAIPLINTPVPASAIQIPVPLDRLERSSQYLVETLMATRATQGFYQSVYANLLPLVSLAQNSVQYITQLREVQDDYALLDMAGEQDGLKVERYRQGYTAINRLLEISLRLIELGSETGESARKTSESIQSLDRSLRNLQQTIEESRLVPFETLAFRARGILRDLSTRVGKAVELTIIGEQIELDAGTLRNLEPVLLHLLRNAYDHGIEEPEQRQQIGKPMQGKIDLAMQRRGSVFELTIRDDGRGIDSDRISQIAKSKGLPLTDTSTPEKLINVLSQSGFTSTKSVSDISGRGVGMDVVASQVALMNGKLSLNTQLGKGTTFTIQIPVPHLFVRCMLLQAVDRLFAIPTTEIYTTTLVESLLWQKTERSDYSMEVQEANGNVPAIDLYQYWLGSSEARPILPTAIAVRTKPSEGQFVGDRGVWLIADTLMGQSDLLVNPIPSPLIAPIGLIGMSLMPDGKLIPVLDALSFVEAFFSSDLEPIATDSLDNSSFLEVSSDRQILVVDDAALMRRRIESSLSPQGYEITTCDDGMEAWQWLQRHKQPALLITDIEMPHMDGFTLIDRCRQAGFAMPILVVSSRLAEEWSRETRRLGATDYLTKGFSTSELVNKVSSLISI